MRNNSKSKSKQLLKLSCPSLQNAAFAIDTKWSRMYAASLSMKYIREAAMESLAALLNLLNILDLLVRKGQCSLVALM